MSFVNHVVQRGAAQLGVVLPAGLIRFLGVGVAGLAVQTGLFTVLIHLGVNKSVAWLVGLAAATALTWFLNRRFTFAATGRRRRSEMTRYFIVTAVAQSVSFGVFHALFAFAPRIPPSIDVICGAVVATLFSYTGQRFFTFSPVSSAPTDPTDSQGLDVPDS